MDGVRLNQAFGDVVSWDLIPRIAIGSITLMPGSNPLFGLNTLGGALAIQTKDGRSSAGTSVQAIYGSNARRAIEFETGGSHTEGLNWYLAGNLFAEDGWREASPSNVGQLFGKLGWHTVKTDLALSGSYADNSLTGNGLQEQRLLASDYASVYTIPDTTDNRAGFFNLTIKHSPSKTVTWSTAAQLGPTGFTATGNFIARPLPAIGGEFPLQQATFYARGTPTTAWFGARFKF